MIACVSTGKYKAMQQESNKYDSLYTWSQRTLKASQDENADLNKQKRALLDQVKSIDLELNASKENNTVLRKQLKDLSALSSAQAESISKSLDNIGSKDAFIRDFQSAVSHRDSINLAVLLNLKALIGGFGDKDIHIKIEKGAVKVDLSDSLLFNGDSTSYTLNDKAKQVLGRLARVLNDQPNVDVIVEGHTDSVAYQQGNLQDNWDLSSKRATAVIRMLQDNYKVAPGRMTAAGRGEYILAAPNDTPEGQAINRRTAIIIVPQVEQLQRLLDRKKEQAATPPPPPPAPVPAQAAPASTPAAEPPAQSTTNSTAPPANGK